MDGGGGGGGPRTIVAEDDGADDGVDQIYQHGAAEGKAFIETIIAGGGEASSGGSGAAIPVLSPLEIYSPGIVFGVGGAEDNGARQMRERELRREADADAVRRIAGIRDAIESTKDSMGMVDANDLMKKFEEIMGV
ncbi:hypothetical protein ACHAXA_000290 [Cyclostephanos tholiformis]|uniref:Uncharacterized protein n=1 Tax=Cyclostephanos tholiformis TaxID=382380 RepID=A0ABD3RN75_9STRA